MNKNETIADIRKEAEARFRELLEKNVDSLGHIQAMQQFNQVFDRIEAAYRRECAEVREIAATTVLEDTKYVPANAAKLREAIQSILDLAYEVAAETEEPRCKISNDWLIETCNAALAEPPRQCDMGTAEEQARRYHNFADRYNPCSYKGYARCAEDCPVHIKLAQEGHGELLCQLEWAQMPYEEGGVDK